MILSNDGLIFIEKREGCYLEAYRDSAGIWTIGWGTIIYPTHKPVKEGDIITKEEADNYLLIECDGISLKLDHIVNVDLEQHQQDAIISFCYNIGVAGFRTSTLLAMINKKLPIIEDYFTRWNKVHKDGKLVAVGGLTNRRKAEFKLYDRGYYGTRT